MAGIGGLSNEVLRRQCAVEENADAFHKAREWDCGIAKLKLIYVL